MSSVSPVIGGDFSLRDVVAQRHIMVCCGTGGVGKTTTAAVLAIEGARQGRRAVVVTIDPAKRLADALGLDALADHATVIEHALWDPEGVSQGVLSALMLDTKSTFDDLVHEHAPDTESAQRILDNRFYRNVSGALGGTQEYMAMEKLYELNASGAFNLIVIDTPPSRHALDFLDAPQRLLRLLDNRMFRLLMAPTRTYMKIAGAALTTLLRTVSRVVGREVVDDAISFFQAFEGMEQGFRDRAAHVQTLIDDPATAFVLVTSPRRDAIEEATFFADRLRSNKLAVAALVVNRIHPEFGSAEPSAIRAAATRFDPVTQTRTGSTEPPEGEGKELPSGSHRAAAELLNNLADYRDVARRERDALSGLTARIGAAAVAHVPLLDHDVHDLASLQSVATYVFPA